MVEAGAAQPSQISPIGLTTEEVQALQLEQGDVTLWEDVASVARAFWGSGSAPMAAHHLLMTVGNFKRQGGTIIRLKRPVDHGQPGESRQDCEIDGSVLRCNDEETWRAFCGAEGGVGGFGVATTSTLLSALWPDTHLIIDRRARDALVGLRGVRLKDWYGRVRNASSPITDLEVTWDDYNWYRRHVHDAVQKVGVEPVALERALFEVDRRRSSSHRKANGVTWQTFGEQLVSVALDAAHSFPDSEVG